MIELVRNILAILGTFTVLAAGSMIIMHGLMSLITQKKKLSKKQERILTYCGIAFALALIPFYYLPA